MRSVIENAIGFLLAAAVVLPAWFLCVVPIYYSYNQPNTVFKYRDSVSIASGFDEGREGVVVSASWSYSSSEWQYLVSLKPIGMEFVVESNLVAKKQGDTK